MHGGSHGDVGQVLLAPAADGGLGLVQRGVRHGVALLRDVAQLAGPVAHARQTFSTTANQTTTTLAIQR